MTQNAKVYGALFFVAAISSIWAWNSDAPNELFASEIEKTATVANCKVSTESPDPYVVVLGVAQDAGFPQAGCNKDCCKAAWADKSLRKNVSCLAIVDPESGERWMLDCTPSFPDQLKLLDSVIAKETSGHQPSNDKDAQKRSSLSGILLTHAHIGHYTGLMHLGREVLGAKSVPVYTMPRMKKFLSANGPWSQLVKLKNIELRDLNHKQPIQLNKRIQVTPLLVPHRDEFSETVGFVVKGPSRSILFVPDVDKWEKWDQRIEEVLLKVDVAYLDGTFFGQSELPGRDMSEIPHPFISESIDRFKVLPKKHRQKVRFIHLNHSNPALNPMSDAFDQIQKTDMAVAAEGEKSGL